jgi:hypothetical protein
MRTIIFLIAAIVVLFFAASAAIAEDNGTFIAGTDTNLKWGDYDKDFAGHAKAGKAVLLYFFSPDAPAFCKTMETVIFSNGSVKSAAGKFQCYKVNSKMTSSIAEKHGVKKGEAAFLILDFQDTEIARLTDAPADPKLFDKQLDEAYKTNDQRKKLLKQLEKWVKEAEQLLKKQDYANAYTYWAEIVKYKGQVKYEEMDRIAEEYERLVKEGEESAQKAAEAGQGVADQLRGCGNQLTTTQQCDQYLQAVQRALNEVNQVNLRYPFPAIKEITKPAQSALVQVMMEINQAKTRIQKEEEAKKKKQ